MDDEYPQLTVQPSASDHFAWMRTHMAIESTLLSAIRTATTLIGFGFTVAQFFYKLQQSVPEELRVTNPALPRNVGLILILCGVGSLAVFTWQYHRSLKYIRGGPFAPIAVRAERSMSKPSYLVSFAVIAVGILAFVSIVLRL